MQRNVPAAHAAARAGEYETLRLLYTNGADRDKKVFASKLALYT